MLVYTPPATLSAGYSSAATYTPSDSTRLRRERRAVVPRERHRQAGCASVSPPAVSTSATRQEVKATDPLATSQFGYVYLFHSDTLTGGSAGTTGVQYTFSLDSGAYTSTYKMGPGSLSPNNTWGFNPEHSTVVTPSYHEDFGDRWLNDGLAITSSVERGRLPRRVRTSTRRGRLRPLRGHLRRRREQPR